MPATLFHKITESFAGSLYVGRSGSNLLYLQQVALRSTTPSQLVDSMVQVLDDMRYLSGTTVAAPSQVVKFMGQIGVVTPFFEAVPLRLLQTAAREKRIPFPVRVATKIGLDVFDGLCQYHALDEKLYGGICPDHLLVGTDGDTRVGNIPVSAITPKESPWRGKVERLAYLAPEQVTSAQGYDARTDVYAIGLILWEMIANQPRLIGSPLHILETLRASRGAPDLSPLDTSKASKGLLNALARAMNPNPSERQPSVGAFALDLLEAEEEPASPAEVAAFVEQVAKETLEPLRTAVAVQQIEAIKESRAPKSEEGATKASTQVVEVEQLLASVPARPPSIPPTADRTAVFNVTEDLLERARRGPHKNSAAAAAVTVPRPRKPTPVSIDMQFGSDKTVSFEVPDDLLEEARRLFVATEKAAEIAEAEGDVRPSSRSSRGMPATKVREAQSSFKDEPTTDQRRAEEFLRQLRSNGPGPSRAPDSTPEAKVEDDVTTIWRPEQHGPNPNSEPGIAVEREHTPHARNSAGEDSTARRRVAQPPPVVQQQGPTNPSIAPSRLVYWLLGLVVSAVVGAITIYASRFLGR